MAEARLDINPPAVVLNQRILRNLGYRLSSLLTHGILLAYSALALFPMFLILINSFKDRQSLFRAPYTPPIWFSLDNGFSLVNIGSTKGYEQVFARADVLSYFGNSIIVTTMSLLL